MYSFSFSISVECIFESYSNVVVIALQLCGCDPHGPHFRYANFSVNFFIKTDRQYKVNSCIFCSCSGNRSGGPSEGPQPGLNASDFPGELPFVSG